MQALFDRFKRTVIRVDEVQNSCADDDAMVSAITDAMRMAPFAEGWPAGAIEPQYGCLKVVVTGGVIRPGMSVGNNGQALVHSVWVANRRVSEVSVGGIAILQLTQPVLAFLKTIRFAA